jgi:hypothetical protein
VSLLPHVDFLQHNSNVALQQCVGFPSSPLPHHITTMWVSFLVWISFNTMPCHVATMWVSFLVWISFNTMPCHVATMC